jgi:hypothetical protein
MPNDENQIYFTAETRRRGGKNFEPQRHKEFLLLGFLVVQIFRLCASAVK